MVLRWLESIINSTAVGAPPAYPPCAFFQAALPIADFDKANFVMQLGSDTSRVEKVHRFCRQHIESCTAASSPDCAIRTIAFVVVMVEAGLLADGQLWELLDSCLDVVPEDMTEQLNVMLNAINHMPQGKSHLWSRVDQAVRSRLEANLGVVFGSESPKSTGTCGSEDGFNPSTVLEAPADVPNRTSENLASVVSSVLGDPSHRSGLSSGTDKSHGSTPPCGSDAASLSSPLSGFSLFELSSTMFGPSMFAFPAPDEPTDPSYDTNPQDFVLPDFLTVAPPESDSSVSQSRVQKWMEAARLEGAQEESKNEEAQRAEYALAKSENEKLQKLLQEARQARKLQELENSRATKQLKFRESSVYSLNDIGVHVREQLQSMAEGHHEEMMFYTSKLNQARQEFKSRHRHETTAIQHRYQRVLNTLSSLQP